MVAANSRGPDAISGHMTELTLERHFDEILPADSKLRKITMLSV